MSTRKTAAREPAAEATISDWAETVVRGGQVELGLRRGRLLGVMLMSVAFVAVGLLVALPPGSVGDRVVGWLVVRALGRANRADLRGVETMSLPSPMAADAGLLAEWLDREAERRNPAAVGRESVAARQSSVSAASRAISTMAPKVCSRSRAVVSSPVTMWSETVQIASALRSSWAASV